MRSLLDPQDTPPGVPFAFEGTTIIAIAGETVATALLASGVYATGTRPVSGQDRGPFCLIGVCFECLMEIDGLANQRACQTIVQENMSVRRQKGVRPLNVISRQRTDEP